MPRKPDLESLLAGESRGDSGALREVEQARSRLLKEWSSGAWLFLTGKDLDGRPIYWTKDEDDPRAPLKPFPGHLEYLRRYFILLECQGDPRSYPRYRATEDYWLELLAHRARATWGVPAGEDPFYNRPLFVDKARQMYVTTGTLAFGLWDLAFHRAKLWLVSKSTEEEANTLIRDKIRFPHSLFPDWIKKALPITTKPENRVTFPRSQSTLMGVTENVAKRAGRGNTASRAFIDEAPLQDMFADILAAILPMCPRMICVGTGNFGSEGEKTFQLYLA